MGSTSREPKFLPCFSCELGCTPLQRDQEDQTGGGCNVYLPTSSHQCSSFSRKDARSCLVVVFPFVRQTSRQDTFLLDGENELNSKFNTLKAPHMPHSSGQGIVVLHVRCWYPNTQINAPPAVVNLFRAGVCVCVCVSPRADAPAATVCIPSACFPRGLGQVDGAAPQAIPEPFRPNNSLLAVEKA